MSIPANPPECTEVMVLFRIISRHDWDRMQSWARACPGAAVEHLYAGLYVLFLPAGGAGVAA
jgi:hypothetical protein